MYIKQVSIFLENSKGKLAEVLALLSSNEINLRALSIADTNDYGVLRLIVNNYEKAVEILKKEHYMVSLADVIAVAVSDDPGGLSKALNVLDAQNVSVEYMYAFIGKTDNRALVILRVDNASAAFEALKDNGIDTISSDTIYGM